MARGKKGKTAKQAKEGDVIADAVPPTDVSSRRLQPCSEEIRISFNFIQRFIREVEKDAPSPTKQGLTIPYDDVVRAQQLCAGLLEQSNSIAVSEADALHPQRTALSELARAKREHTDAVLKANVVGALRKIVGTFPRNITISYESLGKGQKGHCLRLMTSAEKKAILKGPEPVLETIGHIKLKANAARREGGGSEELDELLRDPGLEELLKDPRSFRTDLNEFIERFTPSTRATTGSKPGFILRIPLAETKAETHHFKKGEPLQKLVVDQEVLMTDEEWRDEAKAFRNTLLRHIEVVERFAEQALKHIPAGAGLTTRIEAEELFDRIQEGIEELSRKKDSLVAENKDLQLAIAKKDNDKYNTEWLCAAAMQWLPHLQKKYENMSDGDMIGVFNLILGGIAEMESVKDNAVKMNVPLRAQVAEMKKKLAAESKALRFSQDGRDQDRAKHMQELTKKEGDVSNLLHQVKKAAADFDQYKKSQQKKVEQLTAELSATKSALALKAIELESSVSDADRTQSELNQLHKHSEELQTGQAEREAEVINLRKQLEEAQSSLLSSRTNQQIEQDRIRKAVQGATLARDERIKRLEKELQDLRNEKALSEQARKSDEKNIRELYQDKYSLKEKNQELEEKLFNVAAVQEALERETR